MTEPMNEPTAVPKNGTSTNLEDFVTVAVLGVIAVLGWFLGPHLKSLFPGSGMPALLNFPVLLLTGALYLGLIVAAVAGASRSTPRLSNTAVAGLVVLTGALAVSWFLAPSA